MMLQGVERARSLSIAVIQIARERRSARLSPVDLYDLVKVHCPDEDRMYWAGPYSSPSAMVGLLRYEGFEKIDLGWWGGPTGENGGRKVGELRRLIEAENVMFWEGEDQSWRIVDVTWLSSHRDIWDWLHRQWLGGSRCRFCAMAESTLEELKRPSDRSMQGLVHERCMPHFLAWHAIAAKYSSQAQAEEADKAAGRVSRHPKVKEAARLETTANG